MAHENNFRLGSCGTAGDLLAANHLAWGVTISVALGAAQISWAAISAILGATLGLVTAILLKHGAPYPRQGANCLLRSSATALH